jgi:hypothetical protein
MATDHDEPPGAETGRDSVIESGAEPTPATRPRGRITGLVSALTADRRAASLAAVLAGVALFGSLVSEWQVTAVSTEWIGNGEPGFRSVPTSLVDLGAWGGGYLVGLFVLAGATVLAMFGPPAGARYARLMGLSTGGVLLAMLVALSSTLDDTSRIGAMMILPAGEDQLQPSYGRGIWCALFGVAAAMLALYLAVRHDPPAVPDGHGTEVDLAGRPPVWSRRRPRPVPEEGPAEPFELTVTSTTPFTPSTDDRDGPAGGRGGISE